MKPLCVIGIVNNERGLKIAEEMLDWLNPIYEVHKVYHDGSKFEQPALRYLQDLCIKEHRPCLYLHTKGAYNRSEFSQQVRQIWKHEFTKHWQTYFDLVDRPYAVVSCPFTGSDKTTWYNGFVVNWQAMQDHPTINPNKNRFKFEKLFVDSRTQVIGVVRNDFHRELGHTDRKTLETWSKMN